MGQPLHKLWIKFLPLQLAALVSLIGLTFGVTISLLVVLLRGNVSTSLFSSPNPAGVAAPPTGIAPVFTATVRYWEKDILHWSQEYGVDANILATVIQIESCGHYLVASPAGAQGLFQVMPFHFADGENMLDPNTNAKRGIEYLRGGLELADGHIGLAMAGYNGGWGVIPQGWAGWYQETKLYYIWGSGIYRDALNGVPSDQSEALQSWLRAGGINLCRQAEQVLLSGTPVNPNQSMTLPAPSTQ